MGSMGQNMDNTLAYYQANAASFASSTVDVDLAGMRDRFVRHLPPHARILDFGCGSGRDAKAFLGLGYDVTATDGSPEMCEIARANTGLDVLCMLFQDLDVQQEYDGIWACSSILHLPKEQLADVLARMAAALNPGGVIYTSFKYGTYEGQRNGRYFTDFTLESFQDFIARVPELHVTEHWTTGDARPGRESERWLNLLMTSL